MNTFFFNRFFPDKHPLWKAARSSKYIINTLGWNYCKLFLKLKSKIFATLSKPVRLQLCHNQCAFYPFVPWMDKEIVYDAFRNLLKRSLQKFWYILHSLRSLEISRILTFPGGLWPSIKYMRSTLVCISTIGWLLFPIEMEHGPEMG